MQDGARPRSAPLSENGLPLPSDGRPLSEREYRTAVLGGLEAFGDDASGPTPGEWLDAARAGLLAEFALGRGWSLAGRLSAACDAAACRLLHLAEREHGLPRAPVALAATGGYGRMALFPWSDIDILVVPSGEQELPDAFLRTLHRRIFECFSDRLKLNVGYQFREPSDLADLDSVTRTSLLDLRLISGAGSAFRGLRSALARSHDRPALFLALLAERQTHRLGLSREIYRLEPDLKTDPGGLRDIEYPLWAAHLATDSSLPLLWPFTEGSGIVDPRRLERARRALSMLFDLRFALHQAAARKTDRLFLTQHQAVAELLFPGDPQPLDALMSARFASAAEVHALAESVVEACEQMPIHAGPGLALHHGRIAALPGDADDHGVTPGILAAAGLHARTGAPLSFTLRRELAEHAAESPAVSHEAGAAEFLSLVESPRFASALRLLRDLGVVARLFPELTVSVGRVPYDPSHEYAIFEHTLRALEHIRDLPEAEQDAEGPLPRIWRELSAEDRRVLLIATWLHDMGKPLDRSDHSRAGAALCRQICARLGLPADEGERAARLIELHLEMARCSAFHDLDQDATIRSFAALVGDEPTLSLLYLLTHADTKAVGVGNLREIDRRRHEELYARTLAVLAESGMTERDLRAAAERIRSRAIREVRIPGVSEDRIREHCEQMPPFYVVATPLPVLAGHIAMVRDLSRNDRPVIDFYAPSGADYSELTVCCYDDPGPGLFAKLAGTLYALGVNVHSAQIRTRHGRRPIVIDTFVVDLRGRALPEDVEARAKTHLENVLLGRTSLPELLIKCHRQVPAEAVVHDLRAQNDMSDDHTVVWVTAEDRVGLLFRLSRAFAHCGLNLHSAKIATWGGRAENVFYVTDAEGRKLTDEVLPDLIAQVRQAIDDLAL
jgi:[protein-PII] uridylyltransferase